MPRDLRATSKYIRMYVNVAARNTTDKLRPLQKLLQSLSAALRSAHKTHGYLFGCVCFSALGALSIQASSQRFAKVSKVIDCMKRRGMQRQGAQSEGFHYTVYLPCARTFE